ncbi:hypothetical protein F4604DRAFT_1723328 [Suillus subluteus]|nr:hypothetical protein F4604DRAFT_1723328 [Suillus subluteus]
MPRCEEFDWLIDYLADEASHEKDDESHEEDDETEGDALLALSAMRGLGSSTKRRSYIMTLIHCMSPTRPPRVRHAALRAICDARADLASITIGSMPQGVDAELLDSLSRAIFTVVCPNNDQTVPDRSPRFHYNRDRCFSRLIFALAMKKEWHERLTRDGHLTRCTSLVKQSLALYNWDLRCYLTGIFTFTHSSDKILSLNPRTCIRTTWGERFFLIDALPELVIVTRQLLQGDNSIPDDELPDLARDVHQALETLQERRAIWVNIGIWTQADIDVVLPLVQALDTDLRQMIGNREGPEGGPGSAEF